MAVGVPLEDIDDPAASNAGAVHVFYSNSGGRDELWHQASTGVPGALGDDDQFGFTLAAGDFNDDGCADLAVGAPHEDSAPILADTAAVNIIYGSLMGGACGNNRGYRDPRDWRRGANDRFG
jgi:hypothetical protein